MTVAAILSAIKVPRVRVAVDVESSRQNKPEQQANPNPYQPIVALFRRSLKETS